MQRWVCARMAFDEVTSFCQSCPNKIQSIFPGAPFVACTLKSDCYPCPNPCVRSLYTTLPRRAAESGRP